MAEAAYSRPMAGRHTPTAESMNGTANWVATTANRTAHLRERGLNMGNFVSLGGGGQPGWGRGRLLVVVASGELALIGLADRAAPVLGEFFAGRSGEDAALGVAPLGVVGVAAAQADVAVEGHGRLPLVHGGNGPRTTVKSPRGQAGGATTASCVFLLPYLSVVCYFCLHS